MGIRERISGTSLGFVALVGVNAIWGSTDTVAKIAVEELGAHGLTWLRFTVAFIAFVPVLIIRRDELPKKAVDYLPFVALGLCGFAANFFIFYHGLQLSHASHATALRVSEALAILVLSRIFLGERIGGKAFLGLILGIAGMAFVLDINFGGLSLFGEGYRLGDVLIILGIVVEGLYTVVGKGVLKKTRPLTATALACVCGWLILTAASTGEIIRIASDPPSITAIFACLYLGLVATVFCYWVWYVVLSGHESHRVGVTVMVQPLVGLPMAALVIGEREVFDPGFMAGAALIAAGVYLASRPPSPGSAVKEADG